MINFFGTDGIRGPVGTDFFVREKLHVIGKAIGEWSQHRYGKNARILIIHDTRISCAIIKASLKTGLLLYPITLYDAGILPTPAALHLLKQNKQFDCAISISASHNPAHDNGIKLLTGNGKLSPHDEQMLSELITNHQNSSDSYNTLGQDISIADSQEQYCSIITSYFSASLLANKKIVIDAAHGATYLVAEQIFNALGATTIIINNKPDGTNINERCGTQAPTMLQQTVMQNCALAGFAFDGDGDRIIAVNRHGMLKDGDDILALLLEHPAYAHLNTIVGTQMTNQGFETHLTTRNKQLVRTAVGDKFVVEKLEQLNLLLGGEQSGHIILKDIINTGDGILVALRTLESMLHSGNWDMHTFTKYPQLLINIPVQTKKDLTQSPLSDIITAAQNKLTTGRLLVRFSGTEPLLRIMIEAVTLEHAHTIGHDITQQLETHLKIS